MKRNKKAVIAMQNYLLQLGQELPRYGADGDLGNETITAIDKLDYPSFVKTALKEVGIAESHGKDHNKRVLEYQATTSGKYTDDETPWCGAFVSWVFTKSNIKHGIKIPERARDWSSFGSPTNNPIVGTIAVKSRVGGGHVCIVVGKDKYGNLLCVGGNQNNEVNIGTYKKEVFESFRNHTSMNVVSLPTVDIKSSASVSSEA